MSISSELRLVVVKRALESSKIRFDRVEVRGHSSVVARVICEGVAMCVTVRVAPELMFSTSLQLPEAHDDLVELAVSMLQGLLQLDEIRIRETFALAA